jgi:hypothetical protein
VASVVVGASWIIGRDTVQTTVTSCLLFNFSPLANEFIKVEPWVCIVICLKEDNDISNLTGRINWVRWEKIGSFESPQKHIPISLPDSYSFLLRRNAPS